MRFNKELDDIVNYEAGKPIELVVRDYGISEDEIVKLASNENPNGCSPKVAKAVANSADKMYLYPDDSMFELKSALAKRFEVKSSNIIIGAGSDQVIEMAVRAKANKNQGILRAGITFAMYDIYSKQIGAPIFKSDSITHNLNEMYELYESNKEAISVIFLCLPNNPLGETLPKDEVYEFIKKIDKEVLVVVDGAYSEYASFKDEKMRIEPKELIDTFENTLYLGTFSKAYGLGGMRVGYGIAQEDIIKALYKLRPPFNVTTLSLVAAVEALRDDEFVKNSIEQNFKQMKRYEEFAKELGFEYIESYTNFITYIFSSNINSCEISNKLLQKGMIVRDLSSYKLNGIRVTIGTDGQNSKFFRLFNEVV